MASLLILFLSLSVVCGQHDVIYPTMYENQRLVTRLHCMVSETQHFIYSGKTELWGLLGGSMAINADISLRCLGDDTGGKYESEALKYKVEISNLLLTESNNEEKLSRTRNKRDAATEFFKNSWKKIKSLFNRVFRRGKENNAHPADTPRTLESDAGPPEDDETEENDAKNLLPLYSTPFQFVQLANGTIPEIRFAENEIDDSRVKNFKRHVVDAFATQLNFNQRQNSIVENSVMGEHLSNYDITVNDDEPASLNVAGWKIGNQKMGRQKVTVEKKVTSKDIRLLAPSSALNDKEKIHVNVQQKQIFHGGKLISSSGTSMLSLLPESTNEKRRSKREEQEDDASSYISTQSSFEIQLKSRSRRQIRSSELREREDAQIFVPASRNAEVEDESRRRKENILGNNSAEEMSNILVYLLNITTDQKVYDENMQTVFEVVEGEIASKVDMEEGSMSSIARKRLSKEVMHDLSLRDFNKFKDFLQLLALAGGIQAENVLMSFIAKENTYSSREIQTVADVVSDITRPTLNFITSLADILEQGKSQQFGVLSLSIGHLGWSANNEGREKILGTLSRLLEKREFECDDPNTVDLLEAVGNLGHDDTVPIVLKISSNCKGNFIKIASIHAMRRSIHKPSVQSWMQREVVEGDCEVLREIVGCLSDKIQDQEQNLGQKSWPKHGFNKIDEILRDNLKRSQCGRADILLYFKRKDNQEANTIAKNQFVSDSEPYWNGGIKKLRQKRRALWDDLNCEEWTEDDRYRPIQEKDEFSSDRITYNKRKSCLAFRKLGVKGARAEVYAGMFAGVKEPSDPPKYKLFTKFVSGLNFLGHQMEIGSFYFYHHSGNTKAYVRILGRTRQEFSHEGCTPTDLRYRPLKHIPLYLVNIGSVQLSLGIHLSSQLALDTSCPESDVYELQPLTNVRIGGEAMGTMLFGRGAANVGGNFNYKLVFTFTPSPNMCIKSSHGYDPMSISMETYYQLWNAVKQKWGKPRTWRPSFLSWEVGKGNMKQWFDDTCIATGSMNTTTTIHLDRELE